MVDLVTNDSYSKGESDISITGLVKPPRIRVLEKLHHNEIRKDVSDAIPSLMGRSLHSMLENANATGLSEQRFYLDIDGITISGQLDAVLDGSTIQDYKMVPIRKLQIGVPEEFTAQLNAYAYLIKHGYFFDKENPQQKVYSMRGAKKLQIVAFFKDWFRAGLKKDEYGNYPKAQCLVYEVPLWTEEQQLRYLQERISLHKAANKKLPMCSLQDMWATKDKFAVMKKSRKTSLKNHDSREMAEKHAIDVGGVVEERPGRRIRCEDGWCDVAQFCQQHKEFMKRRDAVVAARKRQGDE